MMRGNIMDFLKEVIQNIKKRLQGSHKHYILKLGFKSALDRDKALDAVKRENIHIDWMDMENPKEGKNGEKR